MAALAEVGLAERAHVLAGPLSHGEKRALELAIALAMQPKLLLLDEPMAGTGREETERLIDVLRRLKGRFPMVLVEHDMTAVFALADRISVLIYGRILASGTPAAVRADPRWSPPISARRWSSHADGRPPRRILRPGAGAVRRELHGRRRRGGHAARPQRHGQDDDDLRADGPAAAARRHGEVRRPLADRAAALSHRAGRPRPRARRPAGVSRP